MKVDELIEKLDKYRGMEVYLSKDEEGNSFGKLTDIEQYLMDTEYNEIVDELDEDGFEEDKDYNYRLEEPKRYKDAVVLWP